MLVPPTNLVSNSQCTYLVASENYLIALCRRKTELYPKWFAITVKKEKRKRKKKCDPRPLVVALKALRLRQT